jgi:Bacterial cadherin-like domain
VSVSANSLLASDVQTTNPTDGLAVTSFSILSADATGSPIIVPVEIFSVLIGNDPSAAADFTKLANATGGKNFQAADASQVVSVLIDALKQSAQAPIAIADTANTTSSTSVEINVLSNDSDPNDDPLTITKINNSDISLGDKVTLSSGAIVSLNDAGILEPGFLRTRMFQHVDVYCSYSRFHSSIPQGLKSLVSLPSVGSQATLVSHLPRGLMILLSK